MSGTLLEAQQPPSEPFSGERACVSSHLPAKATEAWSPHQVPTTLQRRDSGSPSSLEPPFHSSAPGAGPAAAPLLSYLRCLPLKILPPACFAPLTVYPVLPLQVLLGAQTVPVLLLLPWTQSVLIPPGRAGPPLSTPFIPNPQTHRHTHTPQGLLPGAVASAFRPRGL